MEKKKAISGFELEARHFGPPFQGSFPRIGAEASVGTDDDTLPAFGGVGRTAGRGLH